MQMLNYSVQTFEEALELEDEMFEKMFGVRKEIYQEIVRNLSKELSSLDRETGMRYGDEVLLALRYFAKHSPQYSLAQTWSVPLPMVRKAVSKTKKTILKNSTVSKDNLQSLKYFHC